MPASATPSGAEPVSARPRRALAAASADSAATCAPETTIPKSRAPTTVSPAASRRAAAPSSRRTARPADHRPACADRRGSTRRSRRRRAVRPPSAIAPCSSTAARPAACSGPGKCDEAPPPDAARLDRNDEPVVRSRRRSARTPLVGATVGGARAKLPVGEELRLEGEGHFRGDHFVSEVLEDHGRPERLRELVDDEVGRRPPQDERRESLAHLVACAQRVGLPGDDPAVHGFGQGDELDFAMERDQGEAPIGRRVDDDRGNVVVVRSEFEHEACSPASASSPMNAGAQPDPPARPIRSTAAVRLRQQSRDAGAVRDMQPPHRSRRAPHRRPAPPVRRRRRRRVRAPRGPREASRTLTSVRTIRTARMIFATIGHRCRLFCSVGLGPRQPSPARSICPTTMDRLP